MADNPERDATQLLDKRYFGDLPIDPIQIARSLGVQVYVADLHPGWSGALVKRAFEDPVIYLNRADHPNRQRFSCAHELGHYVRRSADAKDDATYEYVDRRDQRASSGTEVEEIYANRFAAALLMPAELVTAERESGATTAALALRFGVSTEAMAHRLTNLGLR